MPLSYAAVMPHGDALIPGIGSPANGHPRLTEAMRETAGLAVQAELDALVIADPHGIGLDRLHSLTFGASAAGTLGHLSMELAIDRSLAEQILNTAVEDGLPLVGVSSEDEDAPLPMEWGTIVPAWFLGEKAKIPPVVIICPSRSHGLDQLARIGRLIARIAEASERRIGLVASADNAHAHLESGPYGFHPEAKRFDELVVKLTKEHDFGAYLEFEPELLETALPDSPWQLAILAGAFEVVPFRTRKVTYECPSYFGMMVASFDRVSNGVVL
ncbi:MAG TPA: hypothetical protein VNA87_01130 [Actinomycetota bacterium]|nr:hypothetical protein [Actinomycetota bacterium]